MNTIYYNVDSKRVCDRTGFPVSTIPELAYGEKPVWSLVLLHDGGETFVPENAVSFKAAVAFDFNTDTRVQCRTLPEKITMQDNTVLIPLDAETVPFLEAVSGREVTRAWFELAGLDRSGDRCFYLIFPINARMILDPDLDENVPEGPDPDYLTATEIYTLLRSGDELQFNTTAEGEGHAVQEESDRYYRFRNKKISGDWSDWIQLPAGKAAEPYETATAEKDGLMSAADKAKLDGLEQIAEPDTSSLTVADEGGFFTSGNVEGVLQEIGSTISGLENVLKGI